MDESFKKLKRKYQRNAIIKSTICGVSFALLVVGICLLVFKLNAVAFNVGYYFLIGIGAVVICGGLMFLIFNPSDKKVAKLLDNEYKLSERAQTALAYQGKDGALVVLQREDTATKLRSLPKHKFKFSKIWQYCVIAVLAISMALTGLLIPAKEIATAIPDGSVDSPWRLSQLETYKVRELIASVRTSHLDVDTKDSVADVLEALLTDLESITTLGAKDESIYAAVSEIDSIITPLNNYQTYVNALEKMSQKYLSHAVMRGVIVYRSATLTTSKEAESFYKKQFDLVGNAIAGPIAALRKEFDNDEELLETIDVNSAMIAAAIVYASNGNTEDEIFTTLNWLVGQLADLKSHIEELDTSKSSYKGVDAGQKEEESEDVSQWQSALDSIFVSFSDRLAEALEIQTYNFAMNKFIGNNLKLIFDLPIDPDDRPLGEYNSDDPVSQNPGVVTPPDIDGDDPSELPGFAAKDQIYEPPGSSTGLGGKYVTLDEVYYYYLGIIQEMLRSDELTEEQRRMVMAYFDMLTGGLKSDKN